MCTSFFSFLLISQKSCILLSLLEALYAKDQLNKIQKPFVSRAVIDCQSQYRQTLINGHLAIKATSLRHLRFFGFECA